MSAGMSTGEAGPGEAALDDATAIVLETLRRLLAEVDPTRARAAIDADQSLTRELALGSLERVELAMRLEQAAGVPLGETVLAEADTPRQIAAAIARARTQPGVPPRAQLRTQPGAWPGASPTEVRGHRGPAVGALLDLPAQRLSLIHI